MIENEEGVQRERESAVSKLDCRDSTVPCGVISVSYLFTEARLVLVEAEAGIETHPCT